MTPVYLKPGDTAYFHPSDENGRMRQGTVVHVFELEDYIEPVHYVIEVPGPIEPMLEVRDPFTVSDAPDRPIGAFRMSDEARAQLKEIQDKVKALKAEELRIRWGR